jgi:hypothetical protein
VLIDTSSLPTLPYPYPTVRPRQYSLPRLRAHALLGNTPTAMQETHCLQMDKSHVYMTYGSSASMMYAQGTVENTALLGEHQGRDDDVWLTIRRRWAKRGDWCEGVGIRADLRLYVGSVEFSVYAPVSCPFEPFSVSCHFGCRMWRFMAFHLCGSNTPVDAVVRDLQEPGRRRTTPQR